MTASYEILRYRPELRDRVLRLLTHLLSPDLAVNDAYLKWKHEQNPYLPGPLIYLALRGAEVVGMRAFFSTRWQIGTPPETFEALYADDLVIAPEHRGQRLPARIMRTAFEELAGGPFRYVFNLSAGQVTVLISLSMGWRSAGPMRPVGRRSQGAAAFQAVSWRMNRWPLLAKCASRAVNRAARLRPFSRIDRVISQREGRIGPDVTVEPGPRCEAMAELVRRLPYDGRIRHVRDAPYLAWRFRKPTGEYRFVYWGGERLEGYLVLQTHRAIRHWPGRVHIVDWEARDERMRAELLHAAMSCGRFAELVTWTATSTPGVRGLLQDAGFQPVDAEKTARGIPCLLVRPIDQKRLAEDWVIAGRRLLDLSNWDLRLIYSMHG
jgi:GNAT superfamily N-acetyltransferase